MAASADRSLGTTEIDVRRKSRKPGKFSDYSVCMTEILGPKIYLGGRAGVVQLDTDRHRRIRN